MIVDTDTTPTGDALDVWLRFHPEDGSGEDPESEAEANTFPTEVGFVVQWYLTAVGLVKGVPFKTLEDAHAFLTREGFQDFSS